MGLFEAIIRALIYLALVALAFFLVVWVFGAIGFPLPGQVVLILKVIFVLFAVLILVRLLWPALSSYPWFPPR